MASTADDDQLVTLKESHIVPYEGLLNLNSTDPDFMKKVRRQASASIWTIYMVLSTRTQQIGWPEWLNSATWKTAEQDQAAHVYGELLVTLPTPDCTMMLRYDENAVVDVISGIWPVTVSAADMTLAESAFNCSELRGTSDYPSRLLLATISRYAHEYKMNQQKYHSPYAALVGPSGIGKSFSVKQLACGQGVYVVYASLASLSSTAYPGTSVIRGRVDGLNTLAEAEVFWFRFMKLGTELVSTARECDISPAQLFRVQFHERFRSVQIELAALLDSSHWEAATPSLKGKEVVGSVMMMKSRSTERQQQSAKQEAELQQVRHHALHSILQGAKTLLVEDQLLESESTPDEENDNQDDEGEGPSSEAGSAATDASLQSTLCVICIDEALALVSSGHQQGGSKSDGMSFLFRAFRRSMAKIFQQATDEKAVGEKNLPFGLLLATSSRVTNFVPTPASDLSARAVSDVGALFQAIHKIPSWDIILSNNTDLCGFLGRCFPPITNPYPSILLDLSEEQATWQHLQYCAGRPLWGALHTASVKQVVNHDDDYASEPYQAAVRTANSTVFELACLKLSASPADEEPGLLALVSVRVSFDVVEKRLAETLASRLMHHIVNVSDDRNIIRITQPSEPILARAAMTKMWDRDVRCSAMRVLLKQYSQGAINAGDMGEKVAALLLLFAADVYNMRSAEPVTVPLQSWLETLVNPMEPNWADSDLHIHLTHFSRLCVRTGPDAARPDGPHTELAHIDPALLQTAFVMGQGWFLEKNCPGADLLVPVWNKRTKRLSVMLVQVKNRQGPRGVTSSLYNMATGDISRAKVHLPFLQDVVVHGLYLNLRPADNTTTAAHVPSNHVRWGRLDQRRKIKVGVVVGFSSDVFPVLDTSELPREDKKIEDEIQSVETSLAQILNWSATGFVYQNDEDVRCLLWTRDASRYSSFTRAE